MFYKAKYNECRWPRDKTTFFVKNEYCSLKDCSLDFSDCNIRLQCAVWKMMAQKRYGCSHKITKDFHVNMSQNHRGSPTAKSIPFLDPLPGVWVAPPPLPSYRPPYIFLYGPQFFSAPFGRLVILYYKALRERAAYDNRQGRPWSDVWCFVALPALVNVRVIINTHDSCITIRMWCRFKRGNAGNGPVLSDYDKHTTLIPLV